MKNLLFTISCLLPLALQAYEEELLFENEQVCVSKWRVLPGETVGQHRDENPSVIIPLKGGLMIRIGEDGATSEVHLPTGQAVYQETDLELHDAINGSDAMIEAIMIELKTKS